MKQQKITPPPVMLCLILFIFITGCNAFEDPKGPPPNGWGRQEGAVGHPLFQNNR